MEFEEKIREFDLWAQENVQRMVKGNYNFNGMFCPRHTPLGMCRVEVVIDEEDIRRTPSSEKPIAVKGMVTITTTTLPCKVEASVGLVDIPVEFFRESDIK